MNTLNTDVLQELQSFMEPDEFRAFLQTACDKLAQQAPVLRQQVTEKNWEDARRIAHRLKGTVGSLGCDSLYAELHSLEEGLRQIPRVLPTAQTMNAIIVVTQTTLVALKQQCALRPAAD